MSEAILGISAYYHDSAAALIIDGEIVAAAQEERFTRVKHDASFPSNAVNYVLNEGGFDVRELSAIAFYDKPFLKFERLLETYHAFVPKGLRSFSSAIPVWLREKIFLKRNIRDALVAINDHRTQSTILFPEHHLSHAASAFYPSPYEEAAILTIDGVGEWATTTIGYGEGNQIKILRELQFPHSIGLLYAAFTYFLGFKVNSGEYKLMGLAPYGNSDSVDTKRFVHIIKEQLVDIREDGSVLLNMKYFSFATGLKMLPDKKWSRLFDIERRRPDEEISAAHMNLALAIQLVLEEIIIKLTETARKLTQCSNLVMAGGVALNAVANGKILRAGLFENIWVQPASSDSGGAIGAALAAWYIAKKKNRSADVNSDAMKGSFLGPEYSDAAIIGAVRKSEAVSIHYPDFNALCDVVAGHINGGKVVGWFQGRMEFGPRALGNRSILADARNPEMQKRLNLKIKKREGFRPFAPAVLEEDAAAYFDISNASPYMLFVVPVKEGIRKNTDRKNESMGLMDILYLNRSDIPAVTHVDYSARLQTVNRETNPKFYRLIEAFKNLTGTGLIINTSFNVRGEPIVCNPADAYRCFMSTDMDTLVMGNLLFMKEDQPEISVSMMFDPD